MNKKFTTITSGIQNYLDKGLLECNSTERSGNGGKEPRINNEQEEMVS